jgi:hypothetical protein
LLQENKLLHQLASIATNGLCEFFSCILWKLNYFFTNLIAVTPTHY